jgi:ABC-type lipoprotein export system ATPase subunit
VYNAVLVQPVAVLVRNHPCAEDFFSAIGVEPSGIDEPLPRYLQRLDDEAFEEMGMDAAELIKSCVAYLEQMELLRQKSGFALREITIGGGVDKEGRPEVKTLSIHPGEIICIVGATGSGKSRLLADIECLAQGDTPTQRRIWINGEVPSSRQRFAVEHKLIAQLSQNMNYIMDLAVDEFIAMHAESRMIPKVDEVVRAVIGCANELAGEPFGAQTPVTALSGGQSRALMIADVALLSESPIVLIDEIENAGVDRKKALDLLVQKEKIVLMSTHDPILALLGHKRIVIKNGGMHRILETSEAERANLKTLERFDRKMMELRNTLRLGRTIDFNLEYFMETGDCNV